VLTAASEAVLSGESVEGISEYSAPWILESEESVSEFEGKENQLVFLCVPNTFPIGDKESNCCFVFVKNYSRESCSFARNEREVIVATVALVCEVLWYSSLKPSALTIRMTGEDTRREKSNTRILDRALLASEGVTQADCGSVESLSALVQESVRRLLEGTAAAKVEGTAETGAAAATATGHRCSVRCALLFPPSPPNDPHTSLRTPPPLRFEHLRAWLAESGLGSEYDVVCRVISSGVSQCAPGSLFWCPIIGSTGFTGAERSQIAGSAKRGLIALLRVEKIVKAPQQSYNRTHYDSLSPFGSSSSSSTLIVEEEGELMKTFCRLIGPAVDRVGAAERAAQWMEQAGQTLTALQGKNSQLGAHYGRFLSRLVSIVVYLAFTRLPLIFFALSAAIPSYSSLPTHHLLISHLQEFHLAHSPLLRSFR
jgi:hypothetical protein